MVTHDLRMCKYVDRVIQMVDGSINRIIADPADIASTAGVGFTINHIAAVFLPALFGMLWLFSTASVFLVGSGLAALSLVLSFNIPARPAPLNEVMVGHWGSIVPTKTAEEG